jgi:hypothetical protein
MKIDKQTFENRWFAAFPNSYAYVASYHMGTTTIRLSHSSIPYNLPNHEQDALSVCIWKDGEVIKDQTGIFIQQGFTPVGPTTITAPVGFQGKVFLSGPGGLGKFEITEIICDGQNWHTVNKKKCECGAHSVGSNRHSSWCEASNG